jgi:hypothetical protein
MLTDGRRSGLFRETCRVAKYAVHGVVTEAEFRAQFLSAAAANGSVAKHGDRWAEGVIGRALVLASRDPLPPVAQRFRTGGGK